MHFENLRRFIDETTSRPTFVPGSVDVRLERSPLAEVVGCAEIGVHGIVRVEIRPDAHELLCKALAGFRFATIRIEEFPGAAPFVSIEGSNEPR